MIIDIICWIGIGICCFYILRNFYVGFLYQITDIDIKAIIKITGVKVQEICIKDLMARRNYYLFVFNPFWWRLSDVFKDKKVREQVKKHMKNLGKI